MVGPDGSVLGATQAYYQFGNYNQVVRLVTVPVSEYGPGSSCGHLDWGVDIDCLISRGFSTFSDYEPESL